MYHNYFKNLAIASVMAIGLMAVPHVNAQISVGVGIGAPYPEPVCSYGYYDYAPYACAPYGYWGPEFFFGGHFRGAGPWDGRGRGYDWHHGEDHFHRGFADHGREGHGGFGGDAHYGHEGHEGHEGHGGHR